MNMKRNQVLSLYQALMAVKLNKMSEGMTDAILADAIELAEVAGAYEKVKDELRKRTIEVIDKSRRAEYDELNTKMQALEGRDRAAVHALILTNYKDVQKAIHTYSKALERWLDKDVQVELQQVDKKEFIRAIKAAEQTITPADMAMLSPLFVGYSEPKESVNVTDLDELLKD